MRVLHVWAGVQQPAHLSYVEQIDLQEKSQGTSRDLVGRSTDGVAELVADGQPAAVLMLKGQKRKKTS